MSGQKSMKKYVDEFKSYPGITDKEAEVLAMIRCAGRYAESTCVLEKGMSQEEFSELRISGIRKYHAGGGTEHWRF
jgi:hypothetical protein